MNLYIRIMSYSNNMAQPVAESSRLQQKNEGYRYIATKFKMLLFGGMLLATAAGQVHAQSVDNQTKVKTFPLRGVNNQLVAGAVAEVKNTDYFTDISNSPRTIDSSSIRNIISFQINESSPLFLKAPFADTVKYRLYFAGKDAVLDSLNADQQLVINYDTAAGSGYKAKCSFVFKGGYTVRIKIVSITSNASGWDPTPALELLNIMEYRNAYLADCAAGAIAGFQVNATGTSTDELLVTWNQLPVADEYDLEWTFIDSSAYARNRYGTPGSPEFIKNVFLNNATRVSLTDTFKSYRIPLLYDGRGLLISRVRAVQVKPSMQRTEFNWTAPLQYDFNGHERSLNWQANTGFAEEGKHKSVVQYFDGSLRNRQTVTKDNSYNTTVVAESIYDFQGRPTIQVLPAPTIKTMIGYTPNFNTLNSRAYDKTDFDSVYSNKTVCDAGADSMSNASGASQYYSPNNPLKDLDFNKYIPDAKDYPFTETQFLQDGTGRVARQGGVGPTFQLGTGHETKYYYGNPDQTELDALFGTEVGYANHYFKNMVRDANGQYSVSYMDMHGRTIATALAGDIPDSIKLDYLDSKKDTLLTKVLTDTSNNIIKGLSIESSKGMIVTKAGNNIFKYSLLPDTLTIADCKNLNICYDCVYDLQVTLSDDCNNKQFNGNPVVISRTNLSIGKLDTTCTPNIPLAIDTTIFLPEGSYTVTKKLTVSNYALNYYLDSVYKVHNLCISIDTFISQQKRIFALAHPTCVKSCDACKTSLGTWLQFKARYLKDNGLATVTAADTVRILATYNKLLADCDYNCEQPKLLNDVDALKSQMLQDLMPPMGQYANPNNIDAVSIFNTASIYSYTKPAIKYKDDAGKLDTVVINGVALIPNNLSQADFIKYFKRSWADALFIGNSHPEYCRWAKMADATATGVGRPSYDWDQDFINTDTYADAMAKGYLNPTNLTAFSTLYPVTFPGNSAKADPFFAKNATYKTQMETAMRRYFIKTTVTKDTLSIWTIASCSASCKEKITDACRILNKANPFGSSASCAGELDMAWRSFRGMYNTKKQQLLRTLIITACSPALGGHLSYFPDANQVIIDSLGINPAADPNAYSTLVKNKAKDQYKSNCESYAAIWWKNLAPCTSQKLQADSVNIIRDLIAVCTKGSDSAHMMGSSSISPDSANGTLKTFDDVINKYVATYNAGHTSDPINNAVCNASLIPFPTAYDKPVIFGNKPIWTKPDSCECVIITGLSVQYKAQSRYSSFADYVKAVRGVTINSAALDSLLNLCNGAITCKYIAAPIILPPGLQCGAGNTCVSCDRMAEVYGQFLSDYPNEQQLINDTTDRMRYDTLMANYFNRKLGYSKEASDYYSFMQTCKIPFYTPTSEAAILQGPLLNFPVTGDASIANVRCDTLQNIINDFKNTYRNLSAWNMVTIKRKVTLNTILEYQLACTSALKPTESSRTVWPQTLRGGSIREGGVGSATRRHLLPFIKFDFNPLSRKMYVDSANVMLSPVLTERFSKDMYYGNMTTRWDTSLQCSQLGVTGWGYKVPTNTPIYQYRTNQNNLVYAYSFLVPYRSYVQYPASHFGAVIAGYLNAATDSIITNTFIASANPLAQTDRETAPHVVITYLVDSIYSCRDLFTTFVNARLNTRLSYASLDTLYLKKCGNVMPTLCTSSSEGNLLCNANIYPAIPGTPIKETPCDDSLRFAIARGTDLYTVYRDSILNVFTAKYTAKCLQAVTKEQFTVSQPISEYHYTLYYYDQAGNLLKTVPPKGVKAIYNAAWLQSVADARRNGTVVKPPHELITNYRYNGLNQVVSQRSPDGGRSDFWYDRLARLVVSQNAKQKAEGNNFSYTKYDFIGRIAEVGQVTANAALLNDSITRRPVLLANWFTANNTKREQVTTTYYDQAIINLGVYMTQNKATLRNRVSYTSFTKGNNPVNYDNGSFYNYDIHGNVKELLQDYGAASMMGLNSNRYKKLAYDYDLISGKVNSVVYQPAYYVPATQTWVQPTDAFYHRYKYDAENKLTEVYSSADGVNWDHDAHYDYYKHGPLARLQLGENQVQGMDYAYTLQGWLKGVNGTVLDSVQDIGQDGNPLNGNRKTIPKDELGYSLHYFDNDYTAISASSAFAGLSQQLKNNNAYKPLYNGNISSMAVNIGKLSASAAGSGGSAPVLYNYQYDQLNRLKAMDMYKGSNSGSNLWSNGLAATTDYRERVQYDANGNITSYLRNGFGAKQTMDSLSYKYIAGKNQLDFVRDQVNGSATHSSNYTEDIDDQLAANYKYDSIGNLVYDRAAGINLIKWSVYGKILEIQKQPQPGNNYSNLQYTYDASGNRIGKITTAADTIKTTWYVRDASGNTMAVYSFDNKKNKLFVDEQHLYGSSRLGIFNPQREVNIPIATVPVGSLSSGYLSTFTRSRKFFEEANHLGNVLVTLSDRKAGFDLNGDGLIDYYKADVVSAGDYYPFGMQMVGRSYSQANSSYRYGFGGQEKSNEIKGEGNSYTAEFWEYDPRLGRRWNLDPKPLEGISEYSAFGNNPIWYSDPLGDTLSNPDLAAAARIGGNEIKDAIKNGRGFFVAGTNSRLIGAAQEYIKNNNLNLGDATDFIGQVDAYHNGLASVAMKSTNEFYKLDRAVINNKNITDFQRLNLTIGFIYNSDANLRGILNISANVALGEAVGGIGIAKGRGPVGPRINSELQQAIVNAGIPKVQLSGIKVAIYRGANGSDALFQLKGGEYKFTDNAVRGLSLHVDAPKLTNARGAAYQLTSMPQGLRIVQQGKDLGHYEIVPTSKISQEQFQSLLNQITVSYTHLTLPTKRIV